MYTPLLTRSDMRQEDGAPRAPFVGGGGGVFGSMCDWLGPCVSLCYAHVTRTPRSNSL